MVKQGWISHTLQSPAHTYCASHGCAADSMPDLNDSYGCGEEMQTDPTQEKKLYLASAPAALACNSSASFLWIWTRCAHEFEGCQLIPACAWLKVLAGTAINCVCVVTPESLTPLMLQVCFLEDDNDAKAAWSKDLDDAAAVCK